MGKFIRLVPNKLLPLVWPNTAFGTVAMQYSSNQGAGTVIFAGRSWATEQEAWAGNLSAGVNVTDVKWYQWFIGW